MDSHICLDASPHLVEQVKMAALIYTVIDNCVLSPYVGE